MIRPVPLFTYVCISTPFVLIPEFALLSHHASPFWVTKLPTRSTGNLRPSPPGFFSTRHRLLSCMEASELEAMAPILPRLRYTPMGNCDVSSQLSDVRSLGIESFTSTHYPSSKYLPFLLLPNLFSKGLVLLPTTFLKLQNLAIRTTIVLGSGIVTLSYLLDTEP